MSVSELRAILGRRVDLAWYQDESTIITKEGDPRAVLISYSDWLELRGAESARGH
jgi:prevent-host-death family protein